MKAPLPRLGGSPQRKKAPIWGQLPRTAYGPKEVIEIFLSRRTRKQMTGQREGTCGFLTDEGLQGVTPGTAICSHPAPQTCCLLPSPAQIGIPKVRVKGQGPRDRAEGQRYLEAVFSAAHSQPLLGLGWWCRKEFVDHHSLGNSPMYSENTAANSVSAAVLGIG